MPKKASRTWAPSIWGSRKQTASYKVPKGGKNAKQKLGDGFGVRIWMFLFFFGAFFFFGLEGPEIGSVRENGSEDPNM